jgi:hypothetical protein
LRYWAPIVRADLRRDGETGDRETVALSIARSPHLPLLDLTSKIGRQFMIFFQ